MFPRRAFLTAAALAALLACLPARADEAAVDALVRRIMGERRIPGLSVAVVRDGRQVLAKGYGLANVETGTPAGPATVYQLASVTKQFTAAGILLLVEDGRLKLDDRLPDLLPEMPATWSGVTVRHLLNHTSGVPSYTSLPGFAGNQARPVSRAELLAQFKDLPPDFPPGERHLYNNSGYFLLGVLLEKVSGKSYEAFLRERIFEPLGMTSTRLNDYREILPNRATGYSRAGETLRNAVRVDPSQPFSAGALVSTVEDLARWEQGLAAGKVLKPETLQQCWTETRLNGGGTAAYGFGWAVEKVNGRRMISHGGGILGFSTFVARYPDDRLFVAVLTNLEGGAAPSLARRIAEVYVPDLAPRPIEDAHPDITRRLRRILEETAEGKPNPDDYAPALRERIFPDGIRQAGELFKASGAIRSFELMVREGRPGERIRREYRVVFERRTLTIHYQLNPEGKLEGVGVTPE